TAWAPQGQLGSRVRAEAASSPLWPLAEIVDDLREGKFCIVQQVGGNTAAGYEGLNEVSQGTHVSKACAGDLKHGVFLVVHRRLHQRRLRGWKPVWLHVARQPRASQMMAVVRIRQSATRIAIMMASVTVGICGAP